MAILPLNAAGVRVFGGNEKGHSKNRVAQKESSALLERFNHPMYYRRHGDTSEITYEAKKLAKQPRAVIRCGGFVNLKRFFYLGAGSERN